MVQSDRPKTEGFPGETSVSELCFEPLDFSRPAGPQILSALKTAILTMVLPPGCFLSESEIGARFGASRTPVREALMQLREAGLVTTLPSRGNFVTRLNRVKILEARFLREAIEIANVCRLVEIGLQPASRKALAENLQEQAQAVAQQDALRFRHLDDRFHSLLAEATGYPRVAQVLEREKMLLDRLRALSLREKGHQKRLLEEHRQIFDAVLAGELSSAVKTARAHLSSILGTLSGLAERHRDYFDESG